MRSTLTRIVLVVLLVYALVSFCAVRRELMLMESIRDGTVSELERLTEENREMKKVIGAGLSDGEITELARKRLGLVMPGELIFYFREGQDNPDTY